MPTWVDNLIADEWDSIASNNISDVQPTRTLTPGSAAAFITAWNSGVLCFVNSQWWLMLWGGGHTDYGGNEIIGINLSANSPAWVLVDSGSDDGDIVYADDESI